MGLASRFHVGADTTIPEHVHRGLQQHTDQLIGRQAGFTDAEACLHLRRHGNPFGSPREHTTTLADQFCTVVLPTRSRCFKQALAFGERRRCIRLRIHKNVQVIEGCHKANAIRQQHTVAKHVPAHVANTHNGEFVGLGVDAFLKEMTFDRLPGALRGNTHFLMVVPLTAAGGKSVTKPEAVFPGKPVRNVREGRRAFVGGHHQVGVIGVVTDHVNRWHYAAFIQVVGQVQQTADECLVAGNTLFFQRLA